MVFCCLLLRLSSHYLYSIDVGRFGLPPARHFSTGLHEFVINWGGNFKPVSVVVFEFGETLLETNRQISDEQMVSSHAMGYLSEGSSFLPLWGLVNSCSEKGKCLTRFILQLNLIVSAQVGMRSEFELSAVSDRWVELWSPRAHSFELVQY